MSLTHEDRASILVLDLEIHKNVWIIVAEHTMQSLTDSSGNIIIIYQQVT